MVVLSSGSARPPDIFAQQNEDFLPVGLSRKSRWWHAGAAR